ncbi:MAG: glutamine--fructose-6-phosphate transaminase (isomerizing), partial [bacterium]
MSTGVNMCGIVGMVSEERFPSSEALVFLKRLEYRGYDSFGWASDLGVVQRRVGPIVFNKSFDACKAVIAHTRWATHGGVTEKNAHPHCDCTSTFYIVHNGIIENYRELKAGLENLGHTFSSQTDSEIISHYFEEALKIGNTVSEAICEFFTVAKGTFAILLLRKGENRIYALKRDSPLVLGLTDEALMLASDIYAFSEKTNKAIFFEDNEFAIIDETGYAFFDLKGSSIQKEIKQFYWQQQTTEHQYEHYMIKEILDEPVAAQRLLSALETTQKDKLDKLAAMVKACDRVLFIGSGTSYHASLIGSYLMRRLGIEAQVLVASELKHHVPPNEKTLVIAVSQSGETMDVIDAMKIAKAHGAPTASIVNVPYSTIQRMTDLHLEILAGQEVCVAATKSFVNQCLLLIKLCSSLGLETGLERILDHMEQVMDLRPKIMELAKDLKGVSDIYLIGRGVMYPVACEIALKLKEIPYIHAEGMMGGELKHGTIALIEDGTPVISLMPEGEEDIVSNTKEVESRGAWVIAITNSNENEFKQQIKISAKDDDSFAILATIIGQLLTYYIAKEKNLPIDKPRNLAKSV